MTPLFTGREWSELGSRDIDGQAERPRERARTSQWLSDLGVYDYRNRLYHPELGRFLQPDPKEFAAGDYNLYRYCHNDPVNKSDPTGQFFIVDDVAEGYLIVAGAAAAYAVVSTPAGQKFIQDAGRLGQSIVPGGLSSSYNSDSPVKDIPGRPPRTGEPGSTVRGPSQTRRYGDDGHPETDHDAPHPGKNVPDSHVHDWGRPEGGGPPTDKDRSDPGDLRSPVIHLLRVTVRRKSIMIFLISV